MEPSVTGFWSPALTVAASGLLFTCLLFAKDWLVHRSLTTMLASLEVSASIAAAELRTAKEHSQAQAVQVGDIKDLSILTHEAVNSQRSKLEAQVMVQRIEFESTIAGLRADLEGIKSLQTELLIQREKDRADAALRLREAQLSPAQVLMVAEPSPAPVEAEPRRVIQP